jgi:hypothetical protein
MMLRLKFGKLAPLALTVSLLTVTPSYAQKTADDSENKGRPISLTGYVRDAACLFRNPAAGGVATEESLGCTKMCMRGGSPLVVYTTADKLYFVLSKDVPDARENDRFLPYAGKLLKIEGRMFERAGARAIVIQKFEVVTNATHE